MKHYSQICCPERRIGCECLKQTILTAKHAEEYLVPIYIVQIKLRLPRCTLKKCSKFLYSSLCENKSISRNRGFFCIAYRLTRRNLIVMPPKVRNPIRY